MNLSSRFKGLVIRLLDEAWIYETFQKLVLSKNEKSLIQELISSRKGKVLDFGCGNGKLAHFFSPLDYLGIDPNVSCIQRAREMFPLHSFQKGSHTDINLKFKSEFSTIVSWGVLHHLDDSSLHSAISSLFESLVEGGLFIALEPVGNPREGFTLRDWVMQFDRGAYIRDYLFYEENLKKLGFKTVEVRIRKDLVRIPYRQAVIIARR